MTGRLYFGDNLHMLKEYIPENSIDLIYLDPPFNSNASYNVLFKSPKGDEAESQIQAFDDTWHWGHSAEIAYAEILASGSAAATIIRALRIALGQNDLMAYLVMMTVRLIEMQRVLRDSGTLYLHCDPTASHYLKVVLDSIFGATNYRNEIVWKRTSTHSDSKTWSRVADTIFMYTKSKDFTWNIPREPHSADYIDDKYRHDDGDGRRYMLDNMTSPNPRPNMMYVWKGFSYPAKGWRYSKDTMAKLDGQGRIWYPRKPDGNYDTSRRPRLKRYLDEMPGGVMGTVWTDIKPVNSQAKERIGYPTQKPLALLSRILEASSNPGDTVLDPFCGCGTTIHAAELGKRNWIGIDITCLAIHVIGERLNRFLPMAQYDVVGWPTSFQDAAELARRDKHLFQQWIVTRIGGHLRDNKLYGGDRGIDGLLYLKTGSKADATGVISVKGGAHLNPSMVRDLYGTCEREQAEYGVLVTLGRPTRGMLREAASCGINESGLGKYPKIQILTVQDIMDGRPLNTPPIYDLLGAAEEARRRKHAKHALSPQELMKQRAFLLSFEGKQKPVQPQHSLPLERQSTGT